MSLLHFTLLGGTTGGAVPVPTVYGGQYDHVARGLARVPDQMKNSTTYLSILKILLGACNELETVFYTLLALKSIDDAQGAVLDLIGALVGQARGGLLDPDYRLRIRVRIAVNHSRALPSDYWRIINLIYPTAKVEVRARGATVEITVHNVVISAADANTLLVILQLAHGAGVRLVLITFPQIEATTFSYRFASPLLSSVFGGGRDITIAPVDLRTYPATGYIKIDAEVLPYAIDVPTWSKMSKVNGGLSSNHTAGALVILCDSSGNELPGGRGYDQGAYANGLTTLDT